VAGDGGLSSGRDGLTHDGSAINAPGRAQEFCFGQALPLEEVAGFDGEGLDLACGHQAKGFLA
jgi:hypothetical protein